MLLAIPTKKDPLARALLLAMAGGVAYLLLATVNSVVQPAEAQGVVIISATPALPVTAPRRQDDPALVLAAPTAQVVYVPVPGPTPPPDVVYVPVAAEQSGNVTTDQADPPADPNLAPPLDVQPAYDPNQFPAQAAAANAAAFQDLPTLQCPCGVDQPSAPPTARDYAYSRARTR